MQPMKMGRGAVVPLHGAGRAIVHLDQRIDPLGVGAQLLQAEGTDLIPRVAGEDGQALLGVGDGHVCVYVSYRNKQSNQITSVVLAHNMFCSIGGKAREVSHTPTKNQVSWYSRATEGYGGLREIAHLPYLKS